jgi:putative chitinase
VDIKTTASPATRDWAKIIHDACPGANAALVSQIAELLDAEFQRGRINTPLRQAHFLAQGAEETDFFTTLVELGPPSYFKRYDYRRDLGNIYPGDGYKFRGRGIFDDTGRRNYKLQSARRGVDLIKNPDLAATPAIAVPDAVDYWVSHGLNQLADADNVVAVTRRINGGTNGLSVRKKFLDRFKHLLGVPGAVHPQGLAALPVPPTPAETQAVQERLKARGYGLVGAVSGEPGAQTTAAVAAFQHDNELPITGEADDATAEALFSSDEQRPIANDRASDAPDDPHILGAAQTLKTGSSLTIGGGVLAAAASSAPDMLSQAEVAKGYVDRVRDLVSPFSGAMGFVYAHPLPILLAAAFVVSLIAGQIVAARIDDHQSLRTP